MTAETQPKMPRPAVAPSERLFAPNAGDRVRDAGRKAPNGIACLTRMRCYKRDSTMRAQSPRSGSRANRAALMTGLTTTRK